MSQLRKELTSDNPRGYPCMSNGTAYLMILQAVEIQDGLIHGRLDADGAHCAIGSYFDINTKTTLPTALVDEVAAVNDSMPTLTTKQRKVRVARWLRWKLKQLGMPGYERARP